MGHTSKMLKNFTILSLLVVISYGRPGIGATTGERLVQPRNEQPAIDTTVPGFNQIEIQAASTLLAILCGSGGIVGGGLGSMVGNELGSQVGDAVFNLPLLSGLTEFAGSGAGSLAGSLAGSGLTCAGILGAVFPNL